MVTVHIGSSSRDSCALGLGVGDETVSLAGSMECRGPIYSTEVDASDISVNLSSVCARKVSSGAFCWICQQCHSCGNISLGYTLKPMKLSGSISLVITLGMMQ